MENEQLHILSHAKACSICYFHCQHTLNIYFKAHEIEIDMIRILHYNTVKNKEEKHIYLYFSLNVNT